MRYRNQSKDNRHDVVRSVRKGTWFKRKQACYNYYLAFDKGYWSFLLALKCPHAAVHHGALELICFFFGFLR
ncbi:hypothetical protein TNCV_452631 [Trichonephila clavipes]|nr:hypothetical protein TNCV_452631 [Trichonephila clavipes]